MNLYEYVARRCCKEYIVKKILQKQNMYDVAEICLKVSLYERRSGRCCWKLRLLTQLSV